MECMACSDNVVRAGLTPKFKDVPTLCSMLNYSCKSAQENLFSSHPHPQDACVTVYNPPIPDFAVMKIEVGIFLSNLLSSPYSLLLMNIQSPSDSSWDQQIHSCTSGQCQHRFGYPWRGIMHRAWQRSHFQCYEGICNFYFCREKFKSPVEIWWNAHV